MHELEPTKNEAHGIEASWNVEEAVRRRYSAASQQAQPALCCPVNYDPKYLDVLPPELIERDYGCGDPSRHVRRGETVLDLGSGGGKICYIASQVVGPEGRVIGVDKNDDMLALAREHQQHVGDAIGYHNVEFRKGRIQDLALDLEAFDRHLAEHPIATSDDWLAAEAHAEHLRATAPMVAGDSVDVIVSNCVLNLVREEDRRQLFESMYRVLKRGGRAVISDITCDEPVPEALKRDPELWSGCLSGAYLESEFLAAFEKAGFYGIEIVERQEQPWATIDGIEFRSVTVQAFKGKEGPCLDRRQSVIYRGPWKSVVDDDGHLLRRGERMAVCDKTFAIYTREPYAGQILAIVPHETVPLDAAPEYDCRRNAVRTPAETKGRDFHLTQLPNRQCCGPGDGCE